MIRYAVIGTGWIARSFIDGAALIPGLSLAAVYSRKEETARAFVQDLSPAPTIYTDLEAMASADDIDAVYIASPNCAHYVQSKIFLEHGKHVLCEKPITVRPEELQELQALAQEKGVIYMEAIIMCHMPQRHIVKEAFGRLGRIRSAHIDFSQLSSKYQDLLAGEVPNIFNPQCCTGALMDLGVYCTYFVAYLWGAPERVTAEASFLDTGADSTGACLLTYPDCLVTMTYGKAGQDRCGSQIQGDQGTLTLDSVSCLSGIRLWSASRTAEEAEELWGSDDRTTMMKNEARDFWRYITDPSGTRAEYEENTRLALTVSRILWQMRRSAAIRFPDDPE
jgi:predicted dehydrogenase